MKRILALLLSCSAVVGQFLPPPPDPDYEGFHYDDSQVPALAIIGGATAPGLISFAGSDDIKVYGFDGGSRNEVGHFTIQLSHRYREGTPIFPHVHWCQTAAPTTATDTNVVWQLTYTFTGVNQAFADVQTLTVTNGISTTNWFHQASSFAGITNSNANVSSILVGSLTRLATDAADLYDKDAALLGFDVHFQVDSPGSRSEFSK